MWPISRWRSFSPICARSSTATRTCAPAPGPPAPCRWERASAARRSAFSASAGSDARSRGARRVSASRIAYCDTTPSPGSPYAYHDSPVALAEASDILVAAVSGGEATRGIVNAAVFEALGPSGLFVNVSRGTVVDEPALIDALARKRIGGACLDVFRSEPDIDKRLLEFENVILQPHQSSGTVETRKAMGKLVRDNLEAHFAGRQLLTPVV